MVITPRMEQSGFQPQPAAQRGADHSAPLPAIAIAPGPGLAQVLAAFEYRRPSGACQEQRRAGLIAARPEISGEQDYIGAGRWPEGQRSAQRIEGSLSAFKLARIAKTRTAGQAKPRAVDRLFEFERSARPGREEIAEFEIEAVAVLVARLGQPVIDQPGRRGEGKPLRRDPDADRVAIDQALRNPVNLIEVQPFDPHVPGIDRIEPAHIFRIVDAAFVIADRTAERVT